MRHAILGAGGIGGLLGAALAHSGEEVTLVLRPEALGNYPPKLSLASAFGSFSVAVERASEVAETFDVLWIAVKATQLESALGSVRSGDKLGAVVPLLNGIDHVERLRLRFGHDRVVPATIAVESERVAPGKIVHRSLFARLSVSSSGEGRLAPAIEKLRKFGFVCQFVENEATLLWGKLVFLAPIALTTTAAGTALGEIVSQPEWRARLERCVSEACSVATASGARVDAAQVMKTIGGLPPGMRSSMQKDVAAGRTPELDAIAGPILRGAQERSIDVAVTRELAGIIRGKTAAASR
jgi:2-dehydropantoate 2-reductase